MSSSPVADAEDTPPPASASAAHVDAAPLQARVLACVQQRAEQGSVRVTVAGLADELQTQAESVRALAAAGQIATATAGRQGLHIRLGAGTPDRTLRPAARTNRRYCPFCGQPSGPTRRFCGGCGEELPR